jgi:hypothetical protein
MPLPFFTNINAATINHEPIYSNLFEFVLITENYHIKDLCYQLEYANTLNENKINVTFSIDSVNFKYLNFDNFLKNIKYVIHVSHDKSGHALNQFLISVKFINSEIRFSHNDSKILEVKLQLDNLSSDEITVPVDDAYLKSLQRDFKLNSLF